MLNAAQIDEFRKEGILKIPGLIDQEPVNKIQAHTRAYFEHIGYWIQEDWVLENVPRIAKNSRFDSPFFPNFQLNSSLQTG